MLKCLKTSMGIALALFSSLVSNSAWSQAATTPSANTAEGRVTGLKAKGVYRFLGIPYAAAPVGSLRWRAPQPAPRHGPLNATKFADACPQSLMLATFAGPPSVTEDCLYLNIYTTGLKPEAGKLRPVIVWFHGGGNVTGSATHYDGSALAAGGSDGTPAVVVTLNYRLGLLGFLAHPSFMPVGQPSVNFGILDQQAALRWIKKNIENFGGDPKRVAISGQSGGSVDVHANVVSPLAAGLFNRAIFQSAPMSRFVPLKDAEKRAQNFAAAAGCTGGDAAVASCLRGLSVPRILQLQGTNKESGPFVDPGNQNVIVDGTVIKMQSTEAYASGQFNKMPVMGGVTTEELTFVTGMAHYYAITQGGSGAVPGTSAPEVAGPPKTEAEYASRIKAWFGPFADAVLAEYRITDYKGDPDLAFRRATFDGLICSVNIPPLKVIAASTPTYGYLFAYQNSPFFLPKMPGFRPYAAHTIDIQYLFRGYHGGSLGVNIDQITGMPRELNPEETQLSNQMIGFWTKFAANGNPNKPGTTIWPQLDPNAPAILREDIPLSTMSEALVNRTYHCAFWNARR